MFNHFYFSWSVTFSFLFSISFILDIHKALPHPLNNFMYILKIELRLWLSYPLDKIIYICACLYFLLPGSDYEAIFIFWDKLSNLSYSLSSLSSRIFVNLSSVSYIFNFKFLLVLCLQSTYICSRFQS